VVTHDRLVELNGPQTVRWNITNGYYTFKTIMVVDMAFDVESVETHHSSIVG
jgi:hypothetical protein